jgi:hypothetical protein
MSVRDFVTKGGTEFGAGEFAALEEFGDGDGVAGTVEEGGEVFAAVPEEFFGVDEVALELTGFGMDELRERRK